MTKAISPETHRFIFRTHHHQRTTPAGAKGSGIASDTYAQGARGADAEVDDVAGDL